MEEEDDNDDLAGGRFLPPLSSADFGVLTGDPDGGSSNMGLSSAPAPSVSVFFSCTTHVFPTANFTYHRPALSLTGPSIVPLV